MLNKHCVTDVFPGTWPKYRMAILRNIFQCMPRKNLWITHPMVFFNPLMFVVTKGHTYLLEVLVEDLQVCMTFSYHHPLKG